MKNDSGILNEPGKMCGSKWLAIYIAAFISILAADVKACDLCGCFMGIVPYDNQSSIGFLHRYRSFSGYARSGQDHVAIPYYSFLQQAGNKRILHGDPPASANPYSSHDYEVYQTYELRAKVFIHKRIELNGILGINRNSSVESDVKQNVSGISDLTLFAGYHVLQRIDSTVQQRLVAGAGCKLPVGNYYLPEPASRVSLLMQPGTGSVDYMGFVNYIVGYKRAGISVNAMYKLNGQNYFKERIGNSTTNYLSLFYKIPVKKLVLIPSFHAYYEYTKGLYVNDVLAASTEMNVILAGPGLDIHYKNIGFSTLFQVKAWEKTASTNLSSAGRFAIGLTYSFNQRKYLIKSKK